MFTNWLQEHDFSKFATGNKDTLDIIPKVETSKENMFDKRKILLPSSLKVYFQRVAQIVNKFVGYSLLKLTVFHPFVLVKEHD